MGHQYSAPLSLSLSLVIECMCNAWGVWFAAEIKAKIATNQKKKTLDSRARSKLNSKPWIYGQSEWIWNFCLIHVFTWKCKIKGRFQHFCHSVPIARFKNEVLGLLQPFFQVDLSIHILDGLCQRFFIFLGGKKNPSVGASSGICTSQLTVGSILNCNDHESGPKPFNFVNFLICRGHHFVIWWLATKSNI